MANKFAINSRDEAEAYLNHPILGARLRECTQLVTKLEGHSIEQIFGHIDVMKFQSSMTLFHHVAPGEELFSDALQKYFGGATDSRTIELTS